MKAQYDPQNPNRVIFQNTNNLFAIAGAVMALAGLAGLVFIPGWERLFALILDLVGVPLLLFADFNRIVVDGSLKTLEIQHRSLARRWSETHPLGDFKGLKLQTSSGDSGLLYRVAFVKNDGGAIPLNSSYDNINVAGKQRDLAILSDISGLPILTS